MCATTLKKSSKEVNLWQANANINKSFVSALTSLNTNRNLQSGQTVRNINLPLITPVITNILKQNIPRIHLDYLTLTVIT